MPRSDDAPPAQSAAAGRPLWLRILRLEPLDAVVDACRWWLIGALIIGVGPGLALWAPLHRDDPKFVLDDVSRHLIKVDLSLDERIEIIEYAAVSVLVMGLIYAGLGWLHGRRHREIPRREYFAELNQRLIPVALLPVFSAFVTEQLEARLQLLTLSLVALVTITMGYWYYKYFSAWMVDLRARWMPLERRGLPFVLMLGLVGAYAATFGYLSVTDHHNLGTHIYDLALYDNTFWNTVNGDSMACSYLRGNTHYSAHFDPIIILLSPIYAINPRAETLLWLQSAWLACGGIPLYLNAKRRLDNPWQALAVVGLYVLAPALHGINMFDFHSLALMVPLVMWMVYFLDVGTPAALIGYWVMLGLLLITREDMPFVAGAISLYAIASRRRLTGVGTIVLALIYLIEIKSETRALLSGDKDSYSYSYYYEEMIPVGDEGLIGLLTTALSDPIAALSVLLKPAKLIYFGKLLLPLLLLPFFAGRKVLLLLYGLAFIGLVSRKYVFSVHFQYSSVLLPFLMMAWPDGLARVTESRIVTRLGLDPFRLRNSMVVAALWASIFVSAKFGAIIPNSEFHAGWNRLHRVVNDDRAQRYHHLWDFIDQIPAEASVCSNSVIGPHISNRPTALKWPSCRKADYVLMTNEKLNKKDRRRLDRLKARSDYEVIDQSPQFLLLHKLPAQAREQARKEARKRRAQEQSAAPKDQPSAPADDAEIDEAPDDDNPYRREPSATPSAKVRPHPDRGRNDDDDPGDLDEP